MESKQRIVAILVAGIFTLSVTAVSADSYRWKDKDGKVHYGAVVPAEYADQPYDVLNSGGMVIDHIEDTSVPLEVLAVKKIQERQPLISDEERKRQSDRLLVIQYSSEEEINQALELEIAQLSYDTKIINQSFESANTALINQIKLAADKQRANQKVSADQQKDIDKLYTRLDQDIKQQQAMKNRENRIRERFQTDLERYQFLTSDPEETNEDASDNS
jgi:hypothetical protein